MVSLRARLVGEIGQHAFTVAHGREHHELRVRNERKPNGGAGGGGRERHVGGGVHGERSSDAGFGALQLLLHRFIREVVAIVKSDLRMRREEGARYNIAVVEHRVVLLVVPLDVRPELESITKTE